MNGAELLAACEEIDKRKYLYGQFLQYILRTFHCSSCFIANTCVHLLGTDKVFVQVFGRMKSWTARTLWYMVIN